MRTQIARAQCTQCVECADRDSFYDDDAMYLCPVCGSTDAPKALKPREAYFIGVALYHTSREYGGPEEGGWYYTSGFVRPWSVRCFESKAEAEVYYAHLQKRAHGYESVRVYLEKIPPLNFPSRRPRYC